ncbi:MAG: ATP-binding protein, partial [Pseudomonadota bacterium]
GVLLATLLPVTVLTVLLSAVFLIARVDDMGEAHSLRARSLARQLATASEYGLFSLNSAHLQTIASGALRESDVRSVAFVDAQGQIVAGAGKPGYKTLPALTRQESESLDANARTDLLVQPITVSQVNLDDLFEAKTADPVAPPQVLGHVLIEMSRESLLQREHYILSVGLGISFGFLLLGGFLAVRLGRGVVSPIVRVSQMIERIGQGELSARAKVLPNDPLRELQQGLNQMAERLESGRDELEQRIAAATLELRAKKEEAETATLAKSHFLATASHDLRQPTHALGMFVARLAQLPHDAQTSQLIGNLDASVRATQDLLDGLLDISRLDAQAVQVQLRPFALADLFDHLRSGLTVTAVEKGIRLRVRPTKVWLMSDSTLLHRIVLNLVTNALRYTTTGSVLVACRVTGDGRHARIEVWDSGIGIAPEHHESIFKEFYQVANAARDRSKGLGLGLNIVERTARLLKHAVQLRSRLGQGTRFTVEVPLVPPGVVLDSRSPLRAEVLGDLAGLVVLVIEDDALVREGLVSLLISWGVVVRVAEDLPSALRQLEHVRVPDVILSDYRLRDDENGIEVIRQVRAAAGQSIPACLMSGDTDPALMQAAQREGLTLLHKPVRPAKLRSLVRRLASGGQTEGADVV